jgi:peptide deformylase
VALRRIRILGDPVLRTRAEEVTEFDKELSRLVADLEDTMLEADGVGLAAPQIGVSLRVFTYVVADPEDPDHKAVGHLVNPVLVETSSDEVDDVEGCLSIPGVSATLRRPRRVVARGFDRHGEPVAVEGTERLARCLAHETDHLDGVLFLDRLEPAERRRVLAELRERALEQGGPAPVVKRSPHAPLGS